MTGTTIFERITVRNVTVDYAGEAFRIVGLQTAMPHGEPSVRELEVDHLTVKRFDVLGDCQLAGVEGLHVHPELPNCSSPATPTHATS